MAIRRSLMSSHPLTFLLHIPAQLYSFSSTPFCVKNHSSFIKPHIPSFSIHRCGFLLRRRVQSHSDASFYKMELNSKLSPEAQSAMLQKGDLIRRKLEEVYPEAPVGFLDNKDPFTLLVAVLLSAQTLDSMVNKVTPKLFQAAGTPAKMRKLGEDRIREIIRPIGLAPRKAHNLVRIAAILCDKYDGQVPDDLEALKELPGVGHKTASVVLIQAFGKPAFPVDTHIHRLACRWGCGDPKSVSRTEDTLKLWFPDPNSWAQLHTRIILFGREHCKARMHDMDTCPICSFAATEEAQIANSANPNKFVGARSHKDPYFVREPRSTSIIPSAMASSSPQINSTAEPSTEQRQQKQQKQKKRRNNKTKSSSVSDKKNDIGNTNSPRKNDEVEENPEIKMPSTRLGRARRGTPFADADGSNATTRVKPSLRGSDTGTVEGVGEDGPVQDPGDKNTVISSVTKASNDTDKISEPAEVVNNKEERLIVTSRNRGEEMKAGTVKVKVTKSTVPKNRSVKGKLTSMAKESTNDVKLETNGTGRKSRKNEKQTSLSVVVDENKRERTSKRKFNSNRGMPIDEEVKSPHKSKKARCDCREGETASTFEGDGSLGKDLAAVSEDRPLRRSARSGVRKDDS